ncbi:SEP-domain-containing protein [Hortaea werneckii]|nr:SEP-domain-containing protein [Hortaea werneckii]
MDDQEKLSQFAAITGANQSTAQGALQAANGDLEQAISLFYAQQEEPDDDEPEVESPAQARPAPSSASGEQHLSNPTGQRRPPGQRPKQMTLGDLQRTNAESDDEDERDRYAGGEKSGLAVENPNQGRSGGGASGADHFKNIMRQAQQNRERPGGDDDDDDEPEQPTRRSAFTGRAQTLGGEGEESRVVEDPSAPTQGPGAGGRQRLPRVTRTMHLWADGVSIDDGPLFRFDDPANQDIMAQINQGRAPLSLLDVQPDQEVDLNLDPHQGENFVQPKKKYKPFSGSGQRLGSPTPGASAAAPAPAAAAPSQPQQQQKPQSSAQVDVDESQPTVQLQIRLGDGTRLSSRFNTTHTIGDVYDFVSRASTESNQRPWALMTTFPSKELEDKKLVLGDMADFKRGGVVVQKWK